MAPKMKSQKRKSTSNDFDLPRKNSELNINPTMNTGNRKRIPKGGITTNSLSSGNVKWDVSGEFTVDLLSDMGVSMLEYDEYEGAPDPTPQPSIPSMVHQRYKPQQADRTGNSDDMEVSTSSPPAVCAKAEEFILCRKNTMDGPKGEDNFSKISDEIVLNIFKWLPKSVLCRCSQVSRRWRRLSNDESLWKRLDLGGKCMQLGDLGRLLQRGTCFVRLAKAELPSPIFATPDFVDSSTVRPFKLMFVDLSMAVISPSDLALLLSRCKMIKNLSLEHCQVNDEVCRFIGCNKRLEVLNMSMCEGILPTGIQYITEGCKRLDALNVAWTNLSQLSLSVLVSEVSTSLSSLDISGCRDTLIDDMVDVLTSRCTALQELDVSDCVKLTGASVESIMANLQCLQFLGLSRCCTIPPCHFLKLKNMPSLADLSIFGLFSDVAMQTVRESLSNIDVNKNPFSVVARPTTGVKRTSIWGYRVRD